MKKGGHLGFTVIELLIVIVVLAVLAAITILSYTAVQDRSRASTASADIAKASKKAGLVKAVNGSFVTTADLLTGNNAIQVGQGSYRVFTVCANTAGSYAAVAEIRNGNVYYSLNGANVVQDNALNSISPCPALGITTPTTVYGGMPTAACAAETQSCVFSGTQTVAFGSIARGEFIALKNQASPVTCSNTTFTDPSPGFSKACYVLQY